MELPKSLLAIFCFLFMVGIFVFEYTGNPYDRKNADESEFDAQRLEGALTTSLDETTYDAGSLDLLTIVWNALGSIVQSVFGLLYIFAILPSGFAVIKTMLIVAFVLALVNAVWKGII